MTLYCTFNISVAVLLPLINQSRRFSTLHTITLVLNGQNSTWEGSSYGKKGGDLLGGVFLG